MRTVVASIEGEYRRYRSLAEAAFAQLSPDQLIRAPGDEDNPVATIAWHIAGNLRSRFTDFLTSDGEKPDRDRDSEFLRREIDHAQLLAFWNPGWDILMAALGTLSDDDLARTVTIRGQPLSVMQALHRSLAHTAYHVGQIVFLAKQLRGRDWTPLSIPRGKSADYNAHLTRERAPVAPASEEGSRRT